MDLHADPPARPVKPSLTRLHQPSSYKECLKNHAATIGGHALDGCGEFMPSDPRSLKCAACGCHRNFHRRASPEHPNFLSCFYSSGPPPPQQLVAPRRLSTSSSPSPGPGPSPMSSPSPPPLSHFPPSHMVLSLGTGYSGPSDEDQRLNNLTAAGKEKGSGKKKRCRSKFTQEQKEKMRLFSEKLGWKMPKGDIIDDGLVHKFCKEIGVSRGVFKVWMHNNKNTFIVKNKSQTTANNNNDHHHHRRSNDDDDDA